MVTLMKVVMTTVGGGGLAGGSSGVVEGGPCSFKQITRACNWPFTILRCEGGDDSKLDVFWWGCGVRGWGWVTVICKKIHVQLR